MTAWVGKNHNTPAWETSAAGPFDRWANGLGFDYFYGFNAGDMNHWDPILFENRNLVPASTDPELPPDHRLRRQGHWLGAEREEYLSGSAVLSVRRAGRHARSPSCAEGMDRQVQR